VTINGTTITVNVTEPGIIAEHVHEENGSTFVSEVRPYLIFDDLDVTYLHYIIYNPTNETLHNVTLNVETPQIEELPYPISYPNRMGWDMEQLTGWSIVSDVLDPRIMRWELQSLSVIEDLAPNQSVEMPVNITVPLTKTENTTFKLSMFANNVRISNRIVIVGMVMPNVKVVGDYHNDTGASDIYIAIKNMTLANSSNIMVEFDLNDGHNTVVYDYFGPYTADSDGKLIIAQRYHFSDYIGGKVYDMHVRVYNGFTLVYETDGKLDLTQKPVKKPNTVIDALFGVFR
jgi:hypothetical protein